MIRRVPLAVFVFPIAMVALAVGSACRSAPVAAGKSPGNGAGNGPDAPPPIVQPGAPGQSTKVITPEKATDLSQVQFTGADIKFMQGMIGHHAQALEMVDLLKARSASRFMSSFCVRVFRSCTISSACA